MNRLRILIENIIREYLCEEGRFTSGPDPHNSRSHRERNVGNPIIGHGNGNHSNADVASMPSTDDIFGAGFKGQHCVVGEKKFKAYLETCFSGRNIKRTMDFFGDSAKGLSRLRSEIDRLNGAAKRNGRSLKWRTITPKDKIRTEIKSNFMLNSFWEYSFNGGQTWFILVPNSIEVMKPSSIKI